MGLSSSTRTGVRPNQLADAVAHLHSALRGSVPLPAATALRAAGELSRAQFGEFAAELFREAVLAGAAEAALVRARVVGVGVVALAAVYLSLG